MDCGQVRACMDREEAWQQENICRIHVHARKFDWTQPPNRNHNTSGTGTGFLLDCLPSDADGLYVVTAHHVVAFAVTARVNFTSVDSELYDADIIGGNAELDIALLRVVDSTLQERLTSKAVGGLVTGDSDKIVPPATVTAHGFALGQAHMQTTKGVVSGRIIGPSRLQTDVAVNPGNSGGPLLDVGKRVIGVVTSGIADAQGINYVAPIIEVCIVLKRVLQGWKMTKRFVADRLPSLNASFVKCNRTLLQNLQCESGVFCCAVHPKIGVVQSSDEAKAALADDPEALEALTSMIDRDVHTGDTWLRLFRSVRGDEARHRALTDRMRRNTLREGDIVCAFTVHGKRYEIDMQKNSRFDFWHDALGFETILDRLQMGDLLEFEIVRNKTRTTAQITLAPDHNMYRRRHVDVEGIDYMVIGGVFVIPLAINHLPFFTKQDLNVLMSRPSSRHRSVLLVTNILPESSYNEGNSIGASDILVSVNNEIVTDLHELQRAWSSQLNQSDDHVVTLRMRDGTITSATVADIVKTDRLIAETYKSEEYIGFRHIPTHFQSSTR